MRGKRPPQNYIHALLGLAIIGFAFYQVRSGFRTEWPLATGRGPVPSAVEDVWIAWVVVSIIDRILSSPRHYIDYFFTSTFYVD